MSEIQFKRPELADRRSLPIILTTIPAEAANGHLPMCTCGPGSIR